MPNAKGSRKAPKKPRLELVPGDAGERQLTVPLMTEERPRRTDWKEYKRGAVQFQGLNGLATYHFYSSSNRPVIELQVDPYLFDRAVLLDLLRDIESRFLDRVDPPAPPLRLER